MSQTLPRSEILRGRKNVVLVFREGRVVPGKFFRCLVLSDSRLDLPTGSAVIFGVAVSSRSVRHAVDRNRIKRFARESYRLHKEILRAALNPELHQPVVLMFVFNTGTGLPPRSIAFRDVEQDIMNILSRIQPKLITEAVR